MAVSRRSITLAGVPCFAVGRIRSITVLPKQITPEAIIKIAWRRKFQILVPFVLAVMAGVFLVVVLPRTYQAETLILVQAQRVPEQYVRATVTIDAGGRLATISQQVMSRTRLEKVIRDLNLYPELREQYPMEKIVGIIRDKIELKVGDKKRRNDDALTSFTIAFTHHDPVVAAKVVNTLASLFIEEHLKVREEQAMGTTTFLERELELQKSKLEEQEKAIEEFKQSHMGELPEQLPSNIGSLQRFQEELSAVQASLSAARDRRVTIQGQMAQTEQGVRELGRGQEQTEHGGERSGGGGGRLRRRPDRDAAKQPRGPCGPAIRTSIPWSSALGCSWEKAEAQARERQAAAEQAEASQPKTPVPASSPVETASSESARLLMAYQTHLNQLQQELQSVSSEIARLLTREEQLYEQIKLYQTRVDNTPQREQQLMSLTRDYTITMEKLPFPPGSATRSQDGREPGTHAKGRAVHRPGPRGASQTAREPRRQAYSHGVPASGLGGRLRPGRPVGIHGPFVPERSDTGGTPGSSRAGHVSPDSVRRGKAPQKDIGSGRHGGLPGDRGRLLRGHSDHQEQRNHHRRVSHGGPGLD